MVKAGVHPKVLQVLMGHKNFNVTMNLYTHLEVSQTKEAAALLQGLLRPMSVPSGSGEAVELMS
jgi:integrase